MAKLKNQKKKKKKEKKREKYWIDDNAKTTCTSTDHDKWACKVSKWLV